MNERPNHRYYVLIERSRRARRVLSGIYPSRDAAAAVAETDDEIVERESPLRVEPGRYHPDPHVHDARTAWFNMLTDPKARKTVGQLCQVGEEGLESRCCLGHACEALRIEKTVKDGGTVLYREQYGILPQEVAKALDVTPDAKLTQPQSVQRVRGTLRAAPPRERVEEEIISLAELNDYRPLHASPQEIGHFLMHHAHLLQPCSTD